MKKEIQICRKERAIIFSLLVTLILSACGNENQSDNGVAYIEESILFSQQEAEKNDKNSEIYSNYSVKKEKLQKHENFEMETPYIEIIDSYEKQEEKSQSYNIKYSLLYVTDDDIPELLVDCCSYWISLYTYVDNKVYPIMEYNPYGTWGRMYEYRYREGIIYSPCYSFEGDTQINYDELYKINDNYVLEALYTYSNSLSYKWNSENEVKYYFDANEISKEQYDEYLGSKYEILEGVYSAEEIKEHL